MSSKPVLYVLSMTLSGVPSSVKPEFKNDDVNCAALILVSLALFLATSSPSATTAFAAFLAVFIEEAAETAVKPAIINVSTPMTPSRYLVYLSPCL